MEIGYQGPHPKTQQMHRQEHLIHAHIPRLNNSKDTGEEPSITSNISNTPTQHGYKTQPPIVTALHTL